MRPDQSAQREAAARIVPELCAKVLDEEIGRRGTRSELATRRRRQDGRVPVLSKVRHERKDLCLAAAEGVLGIYVKDFHVRFSEACASSSAFTCLTWT